MRETQKSLRAYFILVALLSGAINVTGLFRSPLGLDTVIHLVGVSLSLSYLYVGLRLKHLLVVVPSTITAVLVAGAVFQVVAAGVVLLSGMQMGAIVQAAIGLLISWYLLVNSKRLADQAKLEQIGGN